jgi:hypothetical protein
MNLYNLTEEYNAILDLEEIDDTLEEYLDSLDGEITNRIENIVKCIRQCDIDAQ